MAGRPRARLRGPVEKGDMHDSCDSRRAPGAQDVPPRSMFPMTRRSAFPRLVALCATILWLGAAAGCGGNKAVLPAPGSVDADKYLFDHGTDAIAKKHWLTAREYLKKLVDTYPQSQYRQEAKLGIGDTYIGEGTVEGYILGANEFREFLTYYPLNPRADYAQYRIAVALSKQMLGPDRDLTPALDAITELDKFLRLYPSSAYREEVQTLRRTAEDQVSGHDFKVGEQYFRIRWYPGAIDRFKSLLARDPEYAKRDAVYFYLAEALHANRLDAEALPYYDKLIQEFEKSDYLAKAQKRLAELKR
jgi:outer membrane protein assembly factor BamD